MFKVVCLKCDEKEAIVGFGFIDWRIVEGRKGSVYRSTTNN